MTERTLDEKLAMYVSRDEAYARGLKRYYTGIPCVKGHDSERYTSTAGCVQCLRRFTPKKKHDPFNMFHLPYRPLNFGNCEGGPATEKEAQAAFRWMDAAGWLNAAVKILRSDPELFTRFENEWTPGLVPDPKPSVKVDL